MNKILYHRFHIPAIAAICFVFVAFFNGCDSDGNIGADPYGGGKEPLGIRLLTDLPSPSRAYPGDLVTFKAKGLKEWLDDETGSYDFSFYIANEMAEIVAATDTTITVKVPESLSSGISHMLLNGQVFYGPKLTVLGNVTIDKDYGLSSGVPGTVYNYLEHFDRENHFHIVGNFTFSDPRIHHIARIDNRGNLGDGWSDYYRIDTDTWLGIGVDYMNPATQDDGIANYYVKSISYFNNDYVNGKPTVLLSGMFTKYQPVSRFQPISVFNMTKVEYDMNILYDDMLLGGGGSTRIARFNGGTMEPPIATLITSDDKVIAVGNITQYAKVDVDRSFSQELAYEFTPVKTLVCMNSVGELDEIYRKGKEGMTGVIQDACMDEEDGIFITGDLITFDGVNVPNIIRVDKEGNLDAQFLHNIGEGANGPITKIRYNQNRKKMMLVGSFTEFSGTPCNGVVMMNHDGTLDPDFQLRKMEGGTPNFACILDDHDIVVMSGSFKRYDNVSREGFLMLNMDGEAMQKFNVPGRFAGELHQVIETITTTNSTGLLLLGDFYRFNGDVVNSVVMIEVDFD